jgi:DNA-binding response OmpR family regulator
VSSGSDARSETGTGVPSGARPLVLVADDDHDILSLVATGLERSGYAVVTASDGEEAIRLALDRLPDVAVLDVMMPRLSGLDVVRRLRSEPATARMPVLLLTARAQAHDVSEGLEAGASGYCTKPFSPRDLRARIEDLLGAR